MGSTKSATPPATSISNESTVAKIGRCMKKFTKFIKTAINNDCVKKDADTSPIASVILNIMKDLQYIRYEIFRYAQNDKKFL